jgi:hypothetical protein
MAAKHVLPVEISPTKIEIGTKHSGNHGSSPIYTTAHNWSDAATVLANGKETNIHPAHVGIPFKMHVRAHGLEPGSGYVVGGIVNGESGPQLDSALVKNPLPEGTAQLPSATFPAGRVNYVPANGVIDQEFELDTARIVGNHDHHREATFLHPEALSMEETTRTVKDPKTNGRYTLTSISPDSHFAPFVTSTLGVTPKKNTATGKTTLSYTEDQRTQLIETMAKCIPEPTAVQKFGLVLEHEPKIPPLITLTLSDTMAAAHTGKETESLHRGPTMTLGLSSNALKMGGHTRATHDDTEDAAEDAEEDVEEYEEA